MNARKHLIEVIVIMFALFAVISAQDRRSKGPPDFGLRWEANLAGADTVNGLNARSRLIPA